MAEESLLFGDRVWFYDVRTPVRRMAVSTHARQGVVILSTWLGDTCTGTFRLPLSQSATLISVLAEGMAQGLPVSGAGGNASPAPVSRPAPRLWRSWWDALQAWSRGRLHSSDGAAPSGPLRRIK